MRMPNQSVVVRTATYRKGVQAIVPREFDTRSGIVPATVATSRRVGGRPGVGGIGGIGGGFGFTNDCCCSYTTTICMNGYCWPATYKVCISCPFGDSCGCLETGPSCQQIMI